MDNDSPPLHVHRGDDLANWRNATAKLSELAPEEVDESPMVVVIGQQSVGKSSVLEQLCKCPLWTGVKATTLGPTRIESWRHGDSFKAEILIKFDSPVFGAREGEIPWTEKPITDKKGLDLVLRAAGDEARRSPDGSLDVRTWEEVSAVVAAPEQRLPEFTKNLVILKISGPEQPNLTTIDLPGLASDKGEHALGALAHKYLSKERSLKVLCMAGSGAAPNSASEEVKILKDCDPTGGSTIGLITMADKMDNIDESEWGDLIAGENDNFRSFKPQHGWWPLRLRNLTEKRNGIPNEELWAIEDKLFKTKQWQDLADRTGRSFGWKLVSNKIYAHYVEQIRQHLPQLRRRIRVLLEEHTSQLSLLPPEIGDGGVASLYREVIPAIRCTLGDDINQNVKHDGEVFMVNLQAKLRADLHAEIPEFMSFKDDNITDVQPFAGDWWPTRDSKNKLFLDDVQRAVVMTFNQRTRQPDSQRAATRCVENLDLKWRHICEVYNDTVWALVAKLAVEAVKKVCVSKPGAQRIAIDALIELITPFKAKATERLKWQCSRETDDDPNVVEYRDPAYYAELNKACKHYVAQHEDRYHRPRTPTSPHLSQSMLGNVRSRATPGSQALPTPGPSRHGSFADVNVNAADTEATVSVSMAHVSGMYIPTLGKPHRDWDPQFLTYASYIGVQVVKRVLSSARRLDITVGPDIQRFIQDYLKEVEYHLVGAFELDKVVPGTLKRARMACEPDEQIVRERERLKRLKTGLEELSQCLG